MEPKKEFSLSRREQEVVRLAAQGYCDKEIGTELGISLATVRTFWERIRVKTLTRSRTQAVCAYVAPEYAYSSAS